MTGPEGYSGGGYGSGGYGGGGYGGGAGGYPGGPGGPAGPPPPNPPGTAPPPYGGPPYGGGVPPYGPNGPAGSPGGRGGRRVVAVVVVVALLIVGGVIALVVSLGNDDGKGGKADKTSEATMSGSSASPSDTSEPEPSTEPPTTEPPTTEPPATSEPSNSQGSVAVEKVPLSPGDCVLFETVGTGVDKVACTSPHDGQHIENVDLPAAAWPGEAAMDTRASAACKPFAEPVIARQSQPDLLTWLYIYPDESGWIGGDRRVQCLISYVDQTKKLDAPLR
ncbi:septum formation family protein [Streptomyces sp. SID3343]|uniref:septum formation family protein n=1 Tax=Streptomyces sp. SID3343 TaxID=2690260 RepID=UPI00136D5AF7|nr:septum formation family protein [Streptomyces sp. SID3343]MYW03954.1 hypothetical protein [Streptomyces sp. SID3343]